MKKEKYGEISREEFERIFETIYRTCVTEGMSATKVNVFKPLTRWQKVKGWFEHMWWRLR